MTNKGLLLSPKAKLTESTHSLSSAIKWVTSRKIGVAHVTTSAEIAATWVILKCVVTQSRIREETLTAVQVVVMEAHDTKSSRGRRGGNSKKQRECRELCMQ